mmetsp:Transcript_26138/g.38977  ORF Transcript_26138/g.38977 Transcript_26138/m.38977 type:complete len:175 (+) Transcript_26138:31-555(+)
MIFLLQMYPPLMKQETIRVFHNQLIAPTFNLFSFTLRESPTGTDKNPELHIEFLSIQIQASSLQEDTFTCSFLFHPQNQEKHSSTSIYTHHTDDNSQTTFGGKIGTPAKVLATPTPNPIAANVPQTLAKNTTTPILAFRPHPLFRSINPTNRSKYWDTTTDNPNRNGRMILVKT